MKSRLLNSVTAFALGALAAYPSAAARAADTAPSVPADDAAISAITAPLPAPPPVPIGIFADNNLPQGRFVLSITPIFANYSGILIGTRGVSNDFLVSTVPFFLKPSEKVRIVPQDIAVDIQGVRLRYGVTNDFEMILDTGWVEKALDTRVFKGTSGITPLTDNYPETSSIVDTFLTGVYRIYQDDINRFQISLGLSFPTGTDDATFNDFVGPKDTLSNIRAFYGMELGTGTFDILPGAVYAGYLGPWSWGLSYRGRLPLDYNPLGYKYGNLHEFNGWAGYTWTPGITTTFRVCGTTQGHIDGFDPLINGPAVPTNPLFYGGQRVELFGGGSIDGKLIGIDNALILVEAGAPVYQNLNGPQIKKDWQAAARFAFKF
jgi:hypothetical protein